MEFKYAAYDEEGQRRTGVMEAPDDGTVNERLLAAGLLPASVEELKESIWKADLNKYVGSVSLMEVSFLFRQLASALRMGMPITSILSMQAEATKNARFKTILQEMETRIRSGQSLNEGLAGFPKVFKTLHVDMIRAAERAGFTAEALERSAIHMEKSNSIQKKVTQALIYPAIVATISVAAVLILILFVLPRIKDVVGAMGAKIHWFAQAVMDFSTFVSTNFAWVVGGPVALFVAAIVAINTSKGARLTWDKIKLHLPIYGSIQQNSTTAALTRALAEVVSVGLPMNEAVHSIQGAINNKYLEDRFAEAIPYILAGDGFARALARAEVIPPQPLTMLRTAEATGNLVEVARELSRMYDEETDRSLQTMVDLIQPIITVFLGGAVLVVGLAMILAVWSAYSQV